MRAVTRAILYARYSTDNQSESSIVDQLRRCRELAEQHGWPVAGEYTDEGISGAALGNRPGARDALAALSAGDALLIADTTRLARSQDLAPLIARLRHRGIRVLGALDGFDSESRTARMQAGLSGIMSEEFRAQISARTHSALDMRARESRPTGGKCYGFDRAGQPIEAEASIVREIFARAAAGDTQKAIASDLNRRGVPAPGASWSRSVRRTDGVWLVSAVHELLSNERYIGRIVWNRSRWARDPDTGRRQRIIRPESEWIIREGPAIVDAETWAAVRRIAAPRALHGGGRGGGPRYLLSGILVCGSCASRLVATGAGGSWYYCSTHRHGGPDACSMSVGARRDIAEDRLLEPIRQDLLSPEAVELAVALQARWRRADRARTVQPAEIDEIDRRIARIEAQISAGTIEREDVAAAIGALQDRRRAALAAAWRKGSRCKGHDGIAAAAIYRAAVARLGEVLAGPVAQARPALHELLGEVLCAPGEGGLVARVQLNPVPLWQAAGVSWTGSGGRI